MLLSDVNAEAALALLHYLYTADPGVPPRLAPGLSDLAHRSGSFFPFTSQHLTLTDEE